MTLNISIYLSTLSFNCSELIPKDLEKELRNVYVSLCELLKHFWRSFPPTTPQLEEKVIRMHGTLQRFHSSKLKPFEVIFILFIYQINYIYWFTIIIIINCCYYYSGSYTTRVLSSKPTFNKSFKFITKYCLQKIRGLAAEKNANEVAELRD